MATVHGKARLEGDVLTVTRCYESGVPCTRKYTVTRLDPAPEIGFPAIRLTREDGHSYDLIRTPDGWTCECWDFKARREDHGEFCKHLRAAEATGVIEKQAVGLMPGEKP